MHDKDDETHSYENRHIFRAHKKGDLIETMPCSHNIIYRKKIVPYILHRKKRTVELAILNLHFCIF